ncbi:MAG: hypothetical protein RLZ68_435 [Pseudomonadota bacterium]|jgi:hypothetical protein
MTKFLLRRLGVADDPGAFKPSLQNCLEAVMEQSALLMNDVLSGLELSLVVAKGKKSAVVNGVLATTTIQKLSVNADAVKASFSQFLRTAVFEGVALHGGVDRPLVRFDDFQFLEAEQIDANIELALTQQEVVLAVDDVLPPLDALISSLMGWVTVQPRLNPIRPESFVYALRESFKAHIADEASRSSVMTLAAGRLGLSLRQLYKDVTDWLRSQGVEPIGSRALVGVAGGANKRVESTISRTMLTLDKLRSLLSGDLDASPRTLGANDFMHTVPASFEALEDMKMVEPMMMRLAVRAEAHQTRGKSLSLGRQLGEEVVRLMVDNLAQNHQIMPKLRNNLKELEVALLRLVQLDPRFFSERKHPARQMLEKITHRSLAFASEIDPDYARFQTAFENAVHVLCSGDADAMAFARVLRKLENGWTLDEQAQRALAEEAARGLLHAEQRYLVAERLAAEFTEKMLHKRVPDMVVAFLRGPWAQVVAEAQLKSGDASDYLALVDDLVWSVQLKLARRDRGRLVHMLPSMLVLVRQGLQSIGYPNERAAVFFDQLIAFHEKAFETVKDVVSGEKIDSVVGKLEEGLETSGVSPDAYWMADEEASDRGFKSELNAALTQDPLSTGADALEQQPWNYASLNTGSWVDLALAGSWVRAQLTWASPHRTLFMFVSGAGLAHSMTRRTMERLRNTGFMRLVSDGRILDNALDGVAQVALRNDAGRLIEPV